MKKFFSVVMAFLALCFFARMAFAADIDKSVLTYTIPNSAAYCIVTNINATNETSGIVPGKHRIIGYTVSAYAGAGVAAAALLDNITATNSTASYTQAGGLFAETAAPVAGGASTLMFPYPKSLTNGLSVSQSNATIVVVYYERSSP